MGVYAVSFEIKSDSTYIGRYTSFVDQLRLKGKMWDETTAFAIVETDETLRGFQHRLYSKSRFDAEKDKLFVVDVTDRSCITRGAFVMPVTLKSIMPMADQR